MDNTKKSNKKSILIFAVVIALIIAVGGIAVFCNFFGEEDIPSNGVAGTVTDGWDSGIEDNVISQKSGTQIPGYGTASMKEGDESLHLSIGNPKTNECGFYATLKLDDGTILYKSELLKPGYGLTEVPISTLIKSGEYKAVVVYQCVTLDEEETPLNSANSEFTLIVK